MKSRIESDVKLHSDPGSMECPRCHRVQEKKEECIFCGIIISKYFMVIEKKQKLKEELQRSKLNRKRLPTYYLISGMVAIVSIAGLVYLISNRSNNNKNVKFDYSLPTRKNMNLSRNDYTFVLLAGSIQSACKNILKDQGCNENGEYFRELQNIQLKLTTDREIIAMVHELANDPNVQRVLRDSTSGTPASEQLVTYQPFQNIIAKIMPHRSIEGQKEFIDQLISKNLTAGAYDSLKRTNRPVAEALYKKTMAVVEANRDRMHSLKEHASQLENYINQWEDQIQQGRVLKDGIFIEANRAALGEARQQRETLFYRLIEVRHEVDRVLNMMDRKDDAIVTDLLEFFRPSGHLEEATRLEKMEEELQFIEVSLSKHFPYISDFSYTTKVESATQENLYLNPRKHGVFVGIDEYGDRRISPLNGASNDAEALAECFENELSYGDIYVLTNAVATKKNIINALLDIQRISTEEDRFVLFVATHGFITEEKSKVKEAFLATSDTKSDNLIESSIALSELYDVLSSINTNYKILLLDSCRNNPFGEGDNFMSPAFERGISVVDGKLNVKPEVYDKNKLDFGILSACRVHQRAYEIPEKNRGYFSFVLEQAIREEVGDRWEGNWQMRFIYLFNKLGPHPGKDLQQGFIEWYRFDKRLWNRLGSEPVYQTPYFVGKFFDIIKDDPKDIPRFVDNQKILSEAMMGMFHNSRNKRNRGNREEDRRIE